MEYKYITKSRAKKPRAPRPDKWKSGPDINLHNKYYAWLKHRAQANFRNEEYELTFEDWLHLWQDEEQWLNRGKTRECFVLSRKDQEGAWSRANCEIITRHEQLKRTNHLRLGGKKLAREIRLRTNGSNGTTRGL